MKRSKKINPKAIQYPNDRGPLFEGTYEFDLLVKPPYIFYWNTHWITHKFNSLYTTDYNNLIEHGLPKHYKSVYLLGDDLTLLEIYNVCKNYTIKLLVVDNMPCNGIFDKSSITALPKENQPKTFVSRNKANLNFINHILPNLKHLFVYKLTNPSRKKNIDFIYKNNPSVRQQNADSSKVINFENLETLSCVYAIESILNTIEAPKLKTIDIYSIAKDFKQNGINLLKNLKDLQYLRLDSYLFDMLNFPTNTTRLQRIQFYGDLNSNKGGVAPKNCKNTKSDMVESDDEDNDERNSSSEKNKSNYDDDKNLNQHERERREKFHTKLNKEEPSDVVIPINLFTGEQIDKFAYTPKSLGVYSLDTNIYKYIDKFNDNLYIYGSRNIHQVLFVRNNILYCNFNIYNRMNEWRHLYNYFVKSKHIKGIDICGEIVKQTGFEEMWPSTIYKNKGRNIKYDLKLSQLNITASTNDVDKIISLISGVKNTVQLIKTLVINTSGSALNQIVLSQILNNKKFSILNTVINA